MAVDGGKIEKRAEANLVLMKMAPMTDAGGNGPPGDRGETAGASILNFLCRNVGNAIDAGTAAALTLDKERAAGFRQNLFQRFRRDADRELFARDGFISMTCG